MDIRVGKFEIEVSRPWPCWINVKRHPSRGVAAHSLGSFDHRELRDLQYAISRAIWQAEQELGPLDRKSEVG
jgi:hypothetical protein